MRPDTRPGPARPRGHSTQVSDPGTLDSRVWPLGHGDPGGPALRTLDPGGLAPQALDLDGLAPRAAASPPEPHAPDLRA